MKNFLTLDALTKKYRKKTALNNISISVPQGISLLVGPNGSGKSTILSVIEGLTNPTSGTAHIYDYDCTQDNYRILSSGTFLPERPAVFGSGSVSEFLYWYAKFKGTTSEKIMDLVYLFDFEHQLNSSFRSLSMGETEILQIIVALSTDAEFFILDEPNSNLDAQRRALLADIITRINRQNNSDFLITSHILDELLPVSNSIIKIRKGEIENIIKTKDAIYYGSEELQVYTNDPGLIFQELKSFITNHVLIEIKGQIVIVKGKNVRYLIRELSDSALRFVWLVRITPNIDDIDQKSKGEGK